MMNNQFKGSSRQFIEYLDRESQSGDDFEINSLKLLEELCDHCFSFISQQKVNFISQLEKLPEKMLLIVPENVKDQCKNLKQSFIFSANPKLDTIKLIKQFYLEPENSLYADRIHKTAIISPDARIHPSVKIGAFSILENCEIGEGTEIKENVHVYANVTIGKNVRINSSCEIGTSDFGPERDENNELILFPQIGGLIIEDNVEIFPFTAIGKGAIKNTLIKKGVKIDHCCQIGHNTEIGENTVITANSIIAGSAIIGRNNWIGAHSVIKNGICIGDNVVIGIGSVVTKNFSDNQTIAGNPADQLKTKIEERRFLNDLMKKNTSGHDS